MTKSVLISIRPQWNAMMARGEKTIEVRKTRPKLQPPFKCYIYCTRSTDHPAGWLGCYNHNRHKFGLISPLNIEAGKHMNIEVVSGMVVGEFTCDAILPITVFDNGSIQNWNAYSLKEACMSYEDMADYIGRGKQGYGWRIADLKIYDDPKKLDSFIHPSTGCCNEGKCDGCKYLERGYGYLEDDCSADFDTDSFSPLRRPPQSWCYVEEAE